MRERSGGGGRGATFDSHAQGGRAPGRRTLTEQLPVRSGNALDSGASAKLGGELGADFSDVRVHSGPEAAELTREHGARAVTIGSEIAFAPGEYQPNTMAGDTLLAHELAHVVQQRGGGDAAQAKGTSPEPSDHLEEEADRVAGAAVQRIYVGAVPGEPRPTPSLRTAPTPLRTPEAAPVTGEAVDPFLRTVETRITAGDAPGALTEIERAGGNRAGSRRARRLIERGLAGGKLTRVQAFRAVVLLEIGPVRLWPIPVKNFVEGVDKGTFTPATLPPAGKDAIREFCVAAAGAAAAPAGDLLAEYRTSFNAKWDAREYHRYKTEFDPSLSSKGPKNRRAREIFKDLYREPRFKAGYDTDTPSGFRALCDTLVAPDGVNLEASPRLHDLQAAFAPPAITATSTTDMPYVVFSGIARSLATALDARDRQQIERSHQWRLLVDGKINGTTPDETKALREDMWDIITNTRPAAAPAAPGPVAPVGPGPAPAPAPTLTPARTAFLASITMTAPASPEKAETDEHALTFDIRSGTPNPGLAARRRVVIEPAAQVVDGQEDERAWPNKGSAAPHTAKVNPEAAAGGKTTFTARLSMPPVAVADFPEIVKTVDVEDKRLEWFRDNVDAGITCMKENNRIAITSGSTVPFFGGQLPLRIEPRLPARNPGLTVFMEAFLFRSGAFVTSAPKTRFDAGESTPLFSTILEEASPPSATAEKCMVYMVFRDAADALFKASFIPFEIEPALPPIGGGGEAALLAADTAELNRPITAAGSLLNDMVKSGDQNQKKVARAVAAGHIKVEATVVRSDSAAWLKSKHEDPTTLVAYALGRVDDVHTLIGGPGAAGWRTGDFPQHVFLNLTSDTHTGAKRGNDRLGPLLAHEGIHALDREDPASSDDWNSYASEFRAYWVMGVGEALDTSPDPSMSNLGPKSPRARAIFDHLYGHPLYPYVKPAYDDNVDGFREKADNYLAPDGINLTLSPKLAALRQEIESYTGADFGAAKRAIRSKHRALDRRDERAVVSNRDWRDLVESKFSGGEQTKIKSILGIPR